MKVVVEEDCLVTDFSDCSRCVSEMVSLCRIQSNKVYVYCGKVHVLETLGSEVWNRKQFHKVSFQLYS